MRAAPVPPLARHQGARRGPLNTHPTARPQARTCSPTFSGPGQRLRERLHLMNDSQTFRIPHRKAHLMSGHPVSLCSRISATKTNAQFLLEGLSDAGLPDETPSPRQWEPSVRAGRRWRSAPPLRGERQPGRRKGACSGSGAASPHADPTQPDFRTRERQTCAGAGDLGRVARGRRVRVRGHGFVPHTPRRGSGSAAY